MKSKESLVIKSFPRVHIGLFDCGFATSRIFGGAGFSIKGFNNLIKIKKCINTNVNHIKGCANIEPRTYREVEKVLKKLCSIGCPAEIYILKFLPEHIGLGSKTSLLMSVAVGVLSLYKKDIKKDEIARLISRGGTSGIGINIFWEGGLMADSGRRRHFGNKILPSSYQKEVFDFGKIIIHNDMPKDWKVVLFFDEKHKKFSGFREKIFFEKNTPIPNAEINKAIALFYQGIYPSILERDIDGLFQSLKDFNNTAFKRRELSLQSKNTISFLSELWNNEIPSGLSSMGPLIYAIVDKNYNISIDNDTYGLKKIGEFKFNNCGYKIKNAI